MLISVEINSQISNSPYSLFGAGQIEDIGFGVTQSLGGTGIAFQSEKYLNNLNPASYNAIDSLSFLFELGVFLKNTQYSTIETSFNKFDQNLRYLALGFRINKYWASSIGIAPFSSVGYTINSTDNVEGEIETFDKTFEGAGGINQFYWGNSIKILKGLYAGINFSYLLGSIEQSESAYIEDLLSYSFTNNQYISGLYLDYGLQYSIERPEWKYTLGMVYGNKKELSTREDAYYYSADTLDLDVETDESGFYLPQKFGVGIAVDYRDNLKFGIDYERKNWSEINYSNRFLNTRDSERYSMGIEYKPSKSIKDKGFKNMYYRLGAKYNKSYLEIENTPINSKALSFGIGIPVKHDLSLLNFSIEYGVNGTMKNGLIKENYWILNFNVSLHDLWFMKQKFN